MKAGNDISYKILEQAFVEKRKVLEQLAFFQTGDAEEARDIVSKCFLSLWEHHEEVSEDRILAYLFTSVKNACMDYRRADSIHRKVHEDIKQKESRMMEYYSIAIESCDPSSLFAGEITDILKKTVKDLPDAQRRIFILNRVNGLSYKEIADALGIPYKKVDKSLQSVMKKLRSALDEYLHLIILFFIPLCSGGGIFNLEKALMKPYVMEAATHFMAKDGGGRYGLRTVTTELKEAVLEELIVTSLPDEKA